MILRLQSFAKLDEDNALISTSEDEQEESQLYTSYNSDST